MGLHHRLKRLERERPHVPDLALVCMDEQGRIFDDGSDQNRPWVSEHYSDTLGNCKVRSPGRAPAAR